MTGTLNAKRLLALGAAGIVLIAAAACGGTATKSGGAPPAGSGGGGASSTLTMKDTAAYAPAGAPAPSGASAQSSASGGAAPANGATSARGALALPDVLGRKIVMVSTLSVGVKDVARGFEDAGNIATVDGGFIASSAFGHQDGKETASVTIRVPADKYQDALGRLRQLGTVQDEQSNSNDVTQDYTDLQSRLHSLQAALQQYLGFLTRAGDIGQVLQVQDRINQTQAEIEQTQGRINLLNNQTDLATITVHLAPVVPAKPQPQGGSNNPLHVAADAFWQSIEVLRGAATVVLAVAAFSWWLLPLAAGGWYVGRRQLRAHPRPAPPAESGGSA
ncbi:MAG TPA: DUF4349 domain-containing protein [Dehalococcoidia bacterium]|nr:DUF4349 domain-containing protein [Dehalococcoidia bacterium]